MPPLSESAILQACKTLFGPDVSIGKGFLFYLQPSGAKSAYRRKAKETHPDLFPDQKPDILQQQADLFRQIIQAYETLNQFFKQREESQWRVSTDAAPRHGRTKRHPANTETSSSSRETRAQSFYRGSIPFQPLEIGRYLYYRSKISYQSLIDALVWQRQQRPVLGDIALRWGWLNRAAVEQILRSAAFRGRFGEKAVALGFLSDFQVRTLLYYQRTQQERLGNYFLLKKLLTREALDLLVHDMNRHNARVISDLIRTGQRQSIFE